MGEVEKESVRGTSSGFNLRVHCGCRVLGLVHRKEYMEAGVEIFSAFFRFVKQEPSWLRYSDAYFLAVAGLCVVTGVY